MSKPGARDVQIVELHRDGVSVPEIGRQVGRHKSSVLNALRRLGHRECMEDAGKECLKHE